MRRLFAGHLLVICSLTLTGCTSEQMQQAIGEWRATNYELRQKIDSMQDGTTGLAGEIVAVSETVSVLAQGIADLSEAETKEQLLVSAQTGAAFLPEPWSTILLMLLAGGGVKALDVTGRRREDLVHDEAMKRGLALGKGQTPEDLT